MASSKRYTNAKSSQPVEGQEVGFFLEDNYVFSLQYVCNVYM